MDSPNKDKDSKIMDSPDKDKDSKIIDLPDKDSKIMDLKIVRISDPFQT